MFSRIHLLSIAVVVTCSLSANAQTATGVPPFSSVTSGPDIINLGNLNMHLDVPVFARPGRGIPFTYSLGYDSSVYSNVGGVWQPAANFGWHAQTEVVTGYLTYSVTTTACHSYSDFTTKYSNFVYHDPFGRSHAYGVSATDSDCSGVHDVTSYARDGSGYELSTDLAGTGNFYIIEPSGAQILPPDNIANAGASATDANGNQITVDGSGHFTDTLGTVALSISGGAPSPLAFAYTDSNNQPQNVTIYYTTKTVQTYFGCSGVGEYGPYSISLIDHIQYPDGSQYKFVYENTAAGPNVQSGAVTGRIASVQMPTGGTITYGYTNGGLSSPVVGSPAPGYPAPNPIVCADGSAAGMSRNTPDSAQSWTYSRTNPSGTAWTTTVQSPLSDKTVINFQQAGGNFYETSRYIYQGQSNQLEVLYSCYNGASPSCDSTGITLPITEKSAYVTIGNHESRTDTFYNGSFAGSGVVNEVDEYDLVSNQWSLLRQTVTGYASLGNSIIDRPSSVTVLDGGGTQKALTNYYYDQPNTLNPTTGVPQHIGISGSRGNLTQISQWLNTTGGYLNTNLTYDDTGNVLSSKDPGGHTTSFDYTDSWSGTGCGATNTLAYVTTITNALGQQTKNSYYPCTGLLQSTKDQNDINASRAGTTYSYDLMGRLLSTNYPDGGQTSLNYNGYPTPPHVTRTVLASPDPNIVTDDYYDSLGRISSRQLTSDPEGADTVNTTYDALGRVLTVTNPQRSTQSPTDGTTCYGSMVNGVCTPGYDALGRLTVLTEQDGNTLTSTFSDRCVTTSDETGRPKQLCSDGLGRLVSVVEPNPTSGSLTSGSYPTSYGYDTLNNLTQISQQGDGSGARTRSFNYDSLSRMLDATNPETGLVCYGTMSGSTCNRDGYDADGNLIHKTDARGMMTSFGYDALHRIAWTSHSDGSPGNGFNYDLTTEWGLQISNPIGRLVTENTGGQAPARLYQYDAMGRVIYQEDCLPSGTCPTTTAQYDLAGNTTTLNYPSGRTINNTYSSAGRLTSARFASFNGSPENYTYVSTPQSSGAWTNWGYWPDGTPHYDSFGNGTGDAFQLNNRLQTSQMVLGAPAGWNVNSLNYWSDKSYALYDSGGRNNGNILTITDNLNANHTQQYGYDYLNRISMGLQNDGSFNQTFSVDPWGNLRQAGTGIFNQSFDGNNRISGYSYDAAGNLLSDTFHSYAYDVEGRMSNVDSGSSASYAYSPEGVRIRKDQPIGWTEYISFGGSMIAERKSDGTWTDYIYGNGRRLARVELESVDIRFTNDASDSTGDRNLFVNSISNGSNTILPSDPSISYTGAPCNSTQGNVGYILCNGDMIASTSAAGQSITVNAYGTPNNGAYPHMQVWVNGTLQGEWDVTGTAQNYTVQNHVAVRFTNDSCSGCGSGGTDRNLFVNSITVGATGIYPTDPSISYTSAPCNSTQGSVGQLLCNGDMIAATGASGQTITVNAYGTPDYNIYPHMQLWYNQVLIGEWDVTGSAQNYTATIPANRIHYYYSDHLGTARLETDGTGNLVQDCTYSPFGQWVGCAILDSTNHYNFTGLEHDDESNLEHTQFRQLSSAQGRWLSPDPYMGSMDLTNPQSLNRYAYVNNNPLVATDPTGENLFMIEPCGFEAEFEFMCGNGDWFGWIVRFIGPALAEIGGGGGGKAGGTSTPPPTQQPNVNPSGNPPLSGETLGLPNSIPLRIPSILETLGLVSLDPACDFLACTPSPSDTFTDQLSKNQHSCGDLVCDQNNRVVGILPPLARGIHPTNIEFSILGGGFYLSRINSNPFLRIGPGYVKGGTQILRVVSGGPGLPWWWHIWNGPKWPF